MSRNFWFLSKNSRGGWHKYSEFISHQSFKPHLFKIYLYNNRVIRLPIILLTDGYNRPFLWPYGLRRVSTTFLLLELRVWIQPRAWLSSLFWMLRVVRYKSLRQSDPYSRGVLPNVCMFFLYIIMYAPSPGSDTTYYNVSSYSYLFILHTIMCLAIRTCLYYIL